MRLVCFLIYLIPTLCFGKACEGRVFNPVTHMNWNNSFPITVGGIRANAGDAPNNPPLHNMPALCNCGVKPGVGLTFWEPRFVAEVARTAGCLSTIGGVDILGDSSKFLSGETTNGTKTEDSKQSKMQIHWYEYPGFQMLDVAASYGSCVTMPEFQMDAPTEVDVLWNSEMTATVSAPESLLFANPLAALSCVSESVTAMSNYSLDLLYWCAGSQGIVYPLYGRSQNYVSNPNGNLHILEKYMALKHKQGKLLTTIGPTAQCGPMYAPIWTKSQYRFDLIYPVAKNSTIVIGKPDLLWGLGITTPTQTESAFMIWRGRQCCFIPY
jgi:conjugal transfer pilus assembly protein TraU